MSSAGNLAGMIPSSVDKLINEIERRSMKCVCCCYNVLNTSMSVILITQLIKQLNKDKVSCIPNRTVVIYASYLYYQEFVSTVY